MLFERLLRPGIDSLRSAEITRHYIRKQAATIVRAHRSAERSVNPWVALGIPERRYYKLRSKLGVRDEAGALTNDEETLRRIRTYLDDRARRARAMDLLISRGFSPDAARKRLQRSSLEDVADMWPRESRGRG
jgi:hypothetical protein